MRVRRGDAARFFSSSPNAAGLLLERAHWLDSAPQMHATVLPEATPLVDAVIQMAFGWGTITAAQKEQLEKTHDSRERCLLLAKIWEPDFLLLQPDGKGRFILVAGAVCFPSSWALEEKMGQPVEAIHGPVPTLNKSMGGSIGTFLNKIQPGSAWERDNWGLAGSVELNQHPARKLLRLQPPVDLEHVWLRIENQILVGLPENLGLLFGIRLEQHRLADLAQDGEAAAGLIRGLETMPDGVANYKGLGLARTEIIRQLQGIVGGRTQTNSGRAGT